MDAARPRWRPRRPSIGGGGGDKWDNMFGGRTEARGDPPPRQVWRGGGGRGMERRRRARRLRRPVSLRRRLF